VGDLSALRAIAPERHLHRSRRRHFLILSDGDWQRAAAADSPIALRHQLQDRQPPHRRRHHRETECRLVLEDPDGSIPRIPCPLAPVLREDAVDVDVLAKKYSVIELLPGRKSCAGVRAPPQWP
jgi:hypothetical protein